MATVGACTVGPGRGAASDSIAPRAVEVTAAVPTTAAAEPPMFGLLSPRLEQARRDWASANVDSYRLVVAERRNHWLAGCTWTSEVADGLVVSGSVGTADPEQMPCPAVQTTVERLHDEIAGWIEYARSQPSAETSGDHVVSARFDERGVPIDMRYDLANADDEESWQSVAWVVLP